MLDRLTRPPAPSGNPAGNIKRNRVLLMLGVIAFVVVMAFQLMGGGGSSAPRDDATQQTTGESSEFLSEGYDALDDDASSSSSSMWGVWGGILIPLAIVIACIYGGLKGLKYVNGRVARVSSQARVLESLDVLALSQSNAIHLVRVGPRVLAVGASGQSLSVLTELEGEQAEEIVSACRAKDQAQASTTSAVLEPFRDLVQKRIHRTAPPAAEPPADAAPAEAPSVEPLAAVYTPSAAATTVDRPPAVAPASTGRASARPVPPANVDRGTPALIPSPAAEVPESSASAVERLEAALNQIHPDNQVEQLPETGRLEMREAVLKAHSDWLAGAQADELPAAPRERSPRP
jgi:flagellar biogenesis protein FliO